MHKEKRKRSKTSRKITACIISILVCILALALVSFALVRAQVEVEENTFQTGEIVINVNDGEPVITEDEYTFEPGMVVEKEFFIRNEGTWDAYYKLYLEDIKGDLSDVIIITIKDGDTVLAEGTADELTKEAAVTADDVLEEGEEKTLTLTLYYPKGSGNDTQENTLSFTVSADAVQTKNNPDAEYE